MRNKLKLKPCIKVPYANQLYEGFEVLQSRAIIANVSVDKVMDIMLDFIDMHDEPLFFFLEIPSKIPEDFKGGFIDKQYKDIYYLDGCDQQDARNILHDIGDVLCNDGLSSFGFGCLEGEDEIMFDYLNLIRFMAQDIKQYEALMKKYKIEKVDDLFTVEQAYDREHPGYFKLYERDGMSVFDIPAALEEYGMYLAEQREWLGNERARIWLK